MSAALATTLAPRRWLGPLNVQADDAFRRARTDGMSYLRALVVGHVASFRDCWTFRATIAEAIGISTRTVQRGITQARELGIMRTARSKPRERPKGASGPIVCGFSHRWIIAPLQQAAAAASHLARKVSRAMRDNCQAKPTTCDPRRTPRTPAEIAQRAARARDELAALVASWEAEPPPKSG